MGAYIGVAILFSGFGIWATLLPILSADPEPDLLGVSAPFGLTIAAIFIVLAIRGVREKLVLSDESARVHNVLYNRTILRSEVTGYDSDYTMYGRLYPAIQWERNGRMHKTVINFLAPAGVDAPFELGQTGVAGMTDALKAWCETSPNAGRHSRHPRETK